MGDNLLYSSNPIYSNKFGLADSNLRDARKESDEIQFYGHKVRDFNEEELRVAIGLMARMINYEQQKLLNLVAFNKLTLETTNFKVRHD